MQSLNSPQSRIYDFPQPSAAQSFAAYYDSGRKEYLFQNDRGEWNHYTETQSKRILKSKGFSTKVPDGKALSPLDEHLLLLERSYDVTYAGPLAGYQAGFYQEGSSRFLVTTSPTLIEPRTGEWPTIYQLITGLFSSKNCDQRPFVYGWLKIAEEAVLAGQRCPGQALVLAGPHGCGKSLFQNLITEILGGRVAKPYQFMADPTAFNSDLFGAEHLAMEDEQASKDYRARRNFGNQIKNITVNEVQRCHAKYRTALSLRPLWRISISTNDEPENLCVLPPIDDSMEDKLMLLKTFRSATPFPTVTMPERKEFWTKLLSELPAFIAFLLSWQIPPELVSERFGITHFHHPDLLAELDALAPETRLLSLLDSGLFPTYSASKWGGSADELERELCREGFPYRNEALRLFTFPNACGTYLSRLAKKHPHRIQPHRTNERRLWTIHSSVTG